MSTTVLSHFTRAFILAIILTFAHLQPLQAQYQDIGTFMRAGDSDANLLLHEYLKPAGIAFGGNLNQGWFSRAGTHRHLGFDLTVNATATYIPTSERMMELAALDLNFITCIDGQSNAIACPDSPNIVGPDEPGVLIGSTETVEHPLTGQPQRLFETTLPEGSGFPYVPSPMVQASVGILGHTDLTVRFLPPVTIGDAQANLAGIGVKHRINGWIPGGESLPLDLSLQAGFTRMISEIALDARPETDAQTENTYPESHWENQRAELESRAVVVNALAGKDFSFLSLYLGVGYQASTTTLGTPGNYPAIARNPDFDPGESQGPGNQPKIVDSLEDPVDLEFRNEGTLRATAGFSLHLWVFNLNGGFTYSRYPVIRAGLGISIR